MEEVGRLKFFKIIFIFSILGYFSPGQALAQDEPESEEAFLTAVEAELQNEDYQTTLPAPIAEETPLKNFQIPDWLGALFKAVFWILLILLGVFLIYQIARYWDERNMTPKQRREKKVAPVRAFQKGGEKAYIPSLDEVESKALAGHYTEAIHLLLLISLHRVFKFINAPIPEAETSREILNNELVLGKVGDDLGVLVGAVERAVFAGKKPNQKQYLSCRETFDRLTGKLGGSR